MSWPKPAGSAEPRGRHHRLNRWNYPSRPHGRSRKAAAPWKAVLGQVETLRRAVPAGADRGRDGLHDARRRRPASACGGAAAVAEPARTGCVLGAGASGVRRTTGCGSPGCCASLPPDGAGRVVESSDPTGRLVPMPSTRTLNLRLPPELVEDFRRVAGAEDRSIAGELRHLMREAVARAQKDEDPDRRPGPVTTSAGGVGDHGSVYP